MSAVVEPVGHDAARAALRTLAENRASDPASSLHHAWLFAGPAGVGKFQVARWWASRLKCPQTGACGGTCESCRLVASAVHPDVFESGPAPKDKNAVQSADTAIERKKSVGIEESRALISRLALRPLHAGPRIAIMREASTMTVDAQNALLKLLEEPPGAAVIILVADNPGAMLATVRSRCRHLAFGLLAEEEVAEVLGRLGKDPGEAGAAAALARGSVARALTLDADGLAEREKLLLAWESVHADPAGIEALVQALVARKDEGYGLSALLEWQIAKIEASLGARAHEPSPLLGAVLDSSATADSKALVDGATRIQATIDQVARNANARLAIRDLLLNVRDVNAQ